MTAITRRLEPLWTPKNLQRLLNLSLILIVVSGSLVMGFLVARMGFFALAGAAGVLGVVVVLVYGTRVFWGFLMFLMLGYMFAGRGFAYVGFFPLYVGEVGLLLGGLTIGLLAFSNRISLSFKFIWLPLIPLFAVLVIHFLQTIPYIQTYMFDALRDAMMYLYAIYTLIIIVLIPREWVVRFLDRWGRYVALFIPWVIVLYFFMEVFPFPFRFPGSPVPLISVKYGMVGVHLAGAGAFLLLRLDRKTHPWSSGLVWTLWALWALGWVLFGSSNRAGMLSALMGMSVTAMLWPRSGWYRPATLAVVVVWVLLVTNLYSTLAIPTGKGREISAEQMVNNFMSIIASASEEGSGSEKMDNTRQWRVNWWNDIIDYTFNGPYFWNGKGYGINLTESDGYVLGEDSNLRSPHNSHMNFLARGGVPGFAAWVGFLVIYYAFLMYIVFTRRRSDPWSARYAVWFIAYITAFMVNSSFDVVMESPFAAIWFWSLVGMSLLYFTGPSSEEPMTATQEISAASIAQVDYDRALQGARSGSRG